MQKNYLFPFLNCLRSSHAFLSVIFGIFGKFRIDLDIFFSKNSFFKMEKKSRTIWKKYFLRFFGKKVESRKIVLGKFIFPSKNFTWKNKFSQQIFSRFDFFFEKSQKIFFSDCSRFFFHFEKKCFLKKNIKIDPKFPKDSKNHT